ncbi:MAG: uroporphyrinogen decarboxylase family protein [Verrucomicrobiia bacterium]
MKLPFSTAVYEHAARFVNRSPYEVSRNAELLFHAHRLAYLEYRHTPIAVGIDIYNLEAEAYGAKVRVPDDNSIPAISKPLFNSAEEMIKLSPFDPQRDGRIAMVIWVAQHLKQELPEAVVKIPLAGPFSIAFNLLGIMRLCEEVAEKPQIVARMLMRLAENQAVFCKAIVQVGLTPAFFESAAAPPMLSPKQFHELELPALKRIIEIASNYSNQRVPCIMGGNTYPVLDDILSTGTNYLVCNPETDQAAFVKKVALVAPDVKVRVNMRSDIVVSKDRDKIYAEVDRIVQLTRGCSNCILGTGALPYETPIENVRLIREYVERD